MPFFVSLQSNAQHKRRQQLITTESMSLRPIVQFQWVDGSKPIDLTDHCLFNSGEPILLYRHPNSPFSRLGQRLSIHRSRTGQRQKPVFDEGN